MLILSVDTSTRTGSVAVLRDAEVLALISGHDEDPYSSRLFRDIGLLQNRANFKMDEIDVFAVASGPGSFTGLRVGLTAVKAWAEVYRKPIAAISGLEAIAAASLNGENNGGTMGEILAPFLDARRGQVFGAIYRWVPGKHGGLALASDEAILSVEEFLGLVKNFPGQPLVISPTADLLPASQHDELLSGARVRKVSSALATAIGKLGFERARRGKLVNPLTLDANYVRPSDAEAAWKDE